MSCMAAHVDQSRFFFYKIVFFNQQDAKLMLACGGGGGGGVEGVLSEGFVLDF